METSGLFLLDQALEKGLKTIGLGAGGRNRTGTGLAALRIFLPATAFAAPPKAGLGSGLSLRHNALRALGAARLVSTPSRRNGGLGSGSPLSRVPRL